MRKSQPQTPTNAGSGARRRVSSVHLMRLPCVTSALQRNGRWSMHSQAPFPVLGVQLQKPAIAHQALAGSDNFLDAISRNRLRMHTDKAKTELCCERKETIESIE